MSIGWSWYTRSSTLVIGIVFELTGVGGPAPFAAPFRLLLKHPFREELPQAMLLVPSVVCCKLLAGRDFLVTADLKFVQVRQMTFRPNVSKKM
jgi:hypothetical protein